MSKQIVIAEQHRIAAVFSEDQIQELIVATGSHQVSDVYLGIVENVLPGIDAAFVNIGDSERNGFIHVTDLGPLKLRRMAGSITELLAPQQKVLVQIMKEPTGNKGPRLTGNISLPGRYLVLMPYGKGVNLSRRIRNENERNRLRALAILVKPAGMGIVVRTEAENMPEDAIIEDLEALQKQWEQVLQEATTTRAPALLNRDDDFIQRVLRDVYSADVNRIVVDSHTGLKRVRQQLTNWGGGDLPRGVLIDHHRDRAPIMEYFRINAAIREALKPRTDLPSGGYVIIERTEALTVIDVNSGSFTRSATARETVLWTNCEAATEIARQLRLRNIAGIIVVDFIDMDQRRDQLQVLEHFNKALRADKSRPQIAQLTELGLVELTRKRQGKNIYEIFGRACPTCGGLGHLVHLPGDGDTAEGEIVERPAAVSLRESRTADRSISGRGRGRDLVLPNVSSASEPTWEDRSGDDLDDTDDVQDLGLNHPSYQELGGNNRRRRRRRPGDDGRPSPTYPSAPTLKLDPSSDGDPSATSDLPFVGRSDRPERPARGRGRGRGGRESVPSELLPVREGAPAKELVTALDATDVQEGIPEVGYPEERRGRSRRESSRSPQEPPEIIAVEMTPEEQDIYAWMGISPLVLSNQEVKNPKAAVISVVLPGEAPAITPELAEPEQMTLASQLEPVGISLKPKQRVVETNPIEPDPEPESFIQPEIEVSPSAELSADASDLDQVDADGAPITRRRRRRSSAVVSD
ncbi:Rne/Rng family ribonuclease [Stenomitos frigidus]|uniref:Ribonuclease E/G n=1 Tax=Stenomitos frigidus ULC18 TaxID=2107698 RepID=A0A2T1E276_9CYAN|nr:Rne/Rng family ribonuclease [Stenomitos frigidus]PSB26837.1 ribonuclease E/G [Stenomitos frigidus ULC18]